MKGMTIGLVSLLTTFVASSEIVKAQNSDWVNVGFDRITQTTFWVGVTAKQSNGDFVRAPLMMWPLDTGSPSRVNTYGLLYVNCESQEYTVQESSGAMPEYSEIPAGSAADTAAQLLCFD
jgi:hypothetical protein